MTVHDFNASLAKSHKYQDAWWWEHIYRQAFPSFESMQDIKNDGWAQRAGIDRRIHLADGNTIDVDEKVRYKDYGDILLEVWSDFDRKEPGWIQKPLPIDYLAYAVAPSATVYLFPFQLLQHTFRKNRSDWKRAVDEGRPGYDAKKALNESRGRRWTTTSLVLPLDDLLAAMREAMVFHWDAA